VPNHAIMPTFIEIAQTAVEISQFWIFQNGGCRYLGFQNFKFLTVGHAKEVEPLHCAKFRLNRSKPGRHMVIRRCGSIVDKNFKKRNATSTSLMYSD